MKIIESTREFFQSKNGLIPTELKTKYINTLLQVGFDTVDIGSFVSSNRQVSDIKSVIRNLYVSETETNSKLMVMVGTKNNAKKVIKYPEIEYISFPFSISNKYLKKNLNITIDKSLERLDDVIEVVSIVDKKIVVYISMSFGNLYGDKWNKDILIEHVDILNDMGVKTVVLSDTVGLSTPETVNDVFKELLDEYDKIEFGFSLQSNKNWYAILKSSYDVGVRRFDSDMNLNTDNILDFCFDNEINVNIDKEWYKKSKELNQFIFNI